MKPIFAVFTLLLLLGSVCSATPITEQFTITAHSTSGPARTITFLFKSDVIESGTEFDSITVTHHGSGTFCLPDGTTTFADPVATFSCAHFAFASPLTNIVFTDPGGAESDAITLFNDGSGGSGGVFVSSTGVAEPAGLAVLGSGLLILAGVLRRRAKKGTPPDTRRED